MGLAPHTPSFAVSGCSFIQQRLTEEAVMWKERGEEQGKGDTQERKG